MIPGVADDAVILLTKQCVWLAKSVLDAGDAGYSSASSSYSGWERVGEVATQMLVDLARDKGRLLMNVGAVTSLAGFMMSDVLQLRMLNVTGTLCGMAYNCTRREKPESSAIHLTVNLTSL